MERGKAESRTHPGGQPRSYYSPAKLEDLEDSDAVETLTWVDRFVVVGEWRFRYRASIPPHICVAEFAISILWFRFLTVFGVLLEKCLARVSWNQWENCKTRAPRMKKGCLV